MPHGTLYLHESYSDAAFKTEKRAGILSHLCKSHTQTPRGAHCRRKKSAIRQTRYHENRFLESTQKGGKVGHDLRAKLLAVGQGQEALQRVGTPRASLCAGYSALAEGKSQVRFERERTRKTRSGASSSTECLASS